MVKLSAKRILTFLKNDNISNGSTNGLSDLNIYFNLFCESVPSKQVLLRNFQNCKLFSHNDFRLIRLDRGCNGKNDFNSIGKIKPVGFWALHTSYKRNVISSQCYMCSQTTAP